MTTLSGRDYRDLKDVHCFECDRSVRQLGRNVPPQFLSWCSFIECRVLLCPECKGTHEAMHGLAGDEQDDPDRWQYRPGRIRWRLYE